MRFPFRSTGMVLVLGMAGCVRVSSSVSVKSADVSGALETQRSWWRSLATGDTAYLNAHTGESLSLTSSSGRTVGRATAIAEAAPYAQTAPPRFDWSEEWVQSASSSTVVATTRSIETAGSTSMSYRFITVLERRGASWRVITAQSTRESAFTPRVSVAAAGALSDYIGEYRGPRGGIVRVMARDSVLAMVDPSGQQTRLEPIGPSLFEFSQLVSPGIVVRVSFVRDASGRVMSMSRLAPELVIPLQRVR